jgi:hypothetical protein
MPERAGFAPRVETRRQLRLRTAAPVRLAILTSDQVQISNPVGVKVPTWKHEGADQGQPTRRHLSELYIGPPVHAGGPCLGAGIPLISCCRRITARHSTIASRRSLQRKEQACELCSQTTKLFVLNR